MATFKHSYTLSTLIKKVENGKLSPIYYIRTSNEIFIYLLDGRRSFHRNWDGSVTLNSHKSNYYRFLKKIHSFNSFSLYVKLNYTPADGYLCYSYDVRPVGCLPCRLSDLIDMSNVFGPECEVTTFIL